MSVSYKQGTTGQQPREQNEIKQKSMLNQQFHEQQLLKYMEGKMNRQDIELEPQRYFEIGYKQLINDRYLVNLVASDINTEQYLEQLSINEHEPNYFSQLKKLASSLIIVLRTEINVLTSNEQLRDVYINLQQDTSCIIFDINHIIETIKAKRNVTSKRELEEILPQEIRNLNDQMSELRDLYPKYFEVKLSSTSDFTKEFQNYYYSIQYEQSDYDKEYIYILNNLQKYTNILQGYYDDLLRYDNADFNNPRIQRLAQNLKDTILDAKQYLLVNKIKLKQLTKFLINNHQSFLIDLTEDFFTLDQITFDINYSCYQILNLLFIRQNVLKQIHYSLDDVISSLKKLESPLKTETNRNLIVSCEKVLEDVEKQLRDIKAGIKGVRDQQNIQFYQVLLSKKVTKVLKEIKELKTKIIQQKNILNFIKELFGIEQNSKGYLDTADRFIQQHKDIIQGGRQAVPSSEMYRNLYIDSNNLVSNLNQNKEILESYQKVDNYREFNYLYSGLESKIFNNLKQVYAIQESIVNQLRSAAVIQSSKQTKLNKFVSTLSTLQSDLSSFFDIELSPLDLALDIDRLDQLAQKAEGYLEQIRQYEQLQEQAKNTKLMNKEYYQINLEVVTLVLASKNFVKASIIQQILYNINTDFRGTQIDELVSSLRDHLDDMKEIVLEYQGLHPNVYRLHEDRMYLEENLMYVLGVYITSLKTLKRSKKFLKENKENIVLFDFDYFVDFTELSNIYKFQEVIEEALQQLHGVPSYIKNIFYDYNQQHADKIQNSLKLSENFLRNMQQKIQFLNQNKDNYTILQQKFNELVRNSTSVQNKEKFERDKTLEDILTMIDDICVNSEDLRIIRDDLHVTMNEAQLSGNIINIQQLDGIIQELESLQYLLMLFKNIILELLELEKKNFPETGMFDLRLHLDDVISRTSPNLHSTCNYFYKLIDYLFY